MVFVIDMLIFYYKENFFKREIFFLGVWYSLFFEGYRLVLFCYIEI